MGHLRRPTEHETPVVTAGFEVKRDSLTFLWWRSPRHEHEPKHRFERHSRTECCNFSGQLRVCNLTSKGILVVGSDNIDVGKQTAPGQPGSEASPQKLRDGICGAMLQQRGDSGHESAPQKFVQLVGCREPKAGLDPWVRPTRPAAIKR
jgi:hypothetical protein